MGSLGTTGSRREGAPVSLSRLTDPLCSAVSWSCSGSVAGPQAPGQHRPGPAACQGFSCTTDTRAASPIQASAPRSSTSLGLLVAPLARKGGGRQGLACPDSMPTVPAQPLRRGARALLPLRPPVHSWRRPSPGHTPPHSAQLQPSYPSRSWATIQQPALRVRSPLSQDVSAGCS